MRQARRLAFLIVGLRPDYFVNQATRRPVTGYR